MLTINLSYDDEFCTLFNSLKEKYPEKLFEIEGIGKQTDINLFSKQFFTTKTAVADTSVDANSNIDDLTMIAYNTELPKPFLRLNSFYLIWKYAKKLYGIQEANSLIENQLKGSYYINDATGIGIPYCWNFSSYDIMQQGLPFVKKIKSDPPKHLSSFIGQMIHFSVYASNSVLGAVGLADFLVIMSYYVKKLLEEYPEISSEYKWKQVKQELQSFIFSCNQPFRGGHQSGFYNISTYDDNFLEKMSKEIVFPDFSHPDIDLIKKLQNLYIDLMNETLHKTTFTFPITTACFSVDDDKEILDEEFLDTISEKNLDFGFLNIFSGKTSVLSSCCLAGDQIVLAKNSKGIFYSPIKALHEKPKPDKVRLTVFHNGKWVRGNTICVPRENKKMLKLTTRNKKEVVLTEDHLCPTLRGDISVKDLTTEDYLLFNNLCLETYPEKNLNLSYSQGVVIGAYLGDGHTYIRKKNGKFYPSVIFSLNKEKTDKLLPYIKDALLQIGDESNVNVTPRKNTKNVVVTIYSKKISDFIKTYVSGKYGHEKELNLSCLLQSSDFRKGILYGYHATDGGPHNNISTTSKNLITQIECLLTSLGLNSHITITDKTNQPMIIWGKEYKNNYPNYKIKWYPLEMNCKNNKWYIIKNNSIYFKITSIEEVKYEDQNVYCFEIKNKDEPYFTLPNGMILHNCRLRSDTENPYFNQLGAGGTKVGSLSVVSLSLPHIAYESKGDFELFFNLLKENAERAIKINNIKRHIVKKRIAGGALPLYTHGFMDINRQYSTTGIVGINESCEIMGLNILEERGQEFVLEILEIINSINDKATKKYNAPHNMEQTPSENSAIKLAEKDALLGFNDRYKLYSNQFIPLISQANLFDRLHLQGLFDSQMSGGAICHINAENKLSDKEIMKNLIKYSTKTGVIYMAINYNIQSCEENHISIGRKETCQTCGKPIINNFTRVVGFLVNTKNFHKVRREYDYPNRKFYEDVSIEDSSNPN